MKPRNDKKRVEILHSAVKQFRQNGYTRTSYQSIADEVGESRALVQYYFPKKTDFVNIFFEALSTCTTDILTRRELFTKDRFVNFYLIGCVYFAYLSGNKSTKQFVSDILDDRRLSDGILILNTEWLQVFLEEDEEEYEQSLDTTLIRGGGLLTYIHFWILKGHPIETEPIVRENTQERMIQSGIPANMALTLLEPYRIPESTMEDILNELDSALSVRLDDEFQFEFPLPINK